APGTKPAAGPQPAPGPESGLLKRAGRALKLGLSHRAFILYDRVRDLVQKRRPRDYQADPAFEAATFGRAEAFWRMHRKSKNLPLLASQVAEKFQEAMNRYPKSPRYAWALILLGRLNQATGDFHEALGYYELVIREHVKSRYAPLAYLGRARILIGTRREEEATKVYQEVISLYPKSPYLLRAYWGLGKTMLDIGRYDYARSVFVTMLQKWPGVYLKRPEVLYYLGETYFLLRQYAQARHHLYWALNIKPNLDYNHIALARIGDTYKFDKNPGAAKQIYRRVMALYPGTDGAIISRIRLVEMGAGGDPVRVYRGIMKRYRRREVAQLAQLKLGTYYFSRKQYQRATATLNDLLSRHPKSRFREPAVYVLQKVLHQRVLALDRRRRYRALVNFLTDNRARLSPRRRRTYLSLEAKARLHLHQYDQAYDLFHRLYLYGDTSRNVILGLVRSSLGRSDYPRALEAIDEFLRRFQNQPQAEELAYRRGFILDRLGKKAEALKALSHALKRFPGSKWRGRAWPPRA
ncbi:MAG: tetratricopeptide repeat protein, partial [Proteobacteria bacterium]|nr:tetratricopeptide repeat protein [Pseudomonadota bacterium]